MTNEPCPACGGSGRKVEQFPDYHLANCPDCQPAPDDVIVEAVKFGPKYFVMLNGKSVGGSCDDAEVAAKDADAIRQAIAEAGARGWREGREGWKEVRRSAFDEAIAEFRNRPKAYAANEWAIYVLEQLKEKPNEDNP